VCCEDTTEEECVVMRRRRSVLWRCDGGGLVFKLVCDLGSTAGRQGGIIGILLVHEHTYMLLYILQTWQNIYISFYKT